MRNKNCRFIAGLLTVAILVSGCQSDNPTPSVDLGPLSTQVGNLSEANSDLKVANERLQSANAALQAENEHLKAMLRADADAGLAANGKGWLPFERYVWNHQIALLPVSPDTVTAEKWSEASTLYATGKEAAMQHVINGLNADAKTTNAKLGELSQNIEQLTKERDAANEAATAALARVQKAEAALASAVEQAVQNENKRVMAEVRASQVEFWNRCGYGLGIAALGLAAGAFFSPMAKKKLAEGSVLSAVLSAASFASARFFASKWFVWVMGIAGAVAGGALLFHKLKTSHEASETAKKKLVYQKFGEAVVPVMDDAYDNASAEDKAILDAKIFDQLSAVEDAQVKALVDEIRASIKLANVDK